jgi:hypothetical protein
MTAKKYKDTLFEKWFQELDAVIDHEILNYIVGQKAKQEVELLWLWMEFDKPYNAVLNSGSYYFDELFEVGSEQEVWALENTAGSPIGRQQAERFLNEKDHLIQVLDNDEIAGLSKEAQWRLAHTYPLAMETLKHCLTETSCSDIPSCLRSKKLNEDYRINDLGLRNDIPEIVKYHLRLLNRSIEKDDDSQAKPDLRTSIKRNQYIDICKNEPGFGSDSESNQEIIAYYKWGVISTLEDPFRSQVLAYCTELIHAYIKQEANNVDSEAKHIPDYSSLPIPPFQNRPNRRYDSYLPLLIGIYCLKNEHLYEELEDREWEIEFDSFRDFLERDLYVKFDHFAEDYEKYKNIYSKSTKVDLKDFINDVLTRRVRENIKATRKEIERIKKRYFDD